MSRLERKILFWVALIAFVYIAVFSSMPPRTNRITWIACVAKVSYCQESLGLKSYAGVP